MAGEKRWLFAGALVLLAVGLGLRLWGIAAEPLWLDEAYSAYAADHGFHFLWHVVPRYETHPPVYYSLLHLWTLPFGNSLRALRLLGVLASVLTLPLIALAARELARLLEWDDTRTRRLMFVAFALGCLAIELIEMGHQVRPYPLMILVYAGATLLLLRLARTRAIGGPAFVAYLGTVEAMLWLHNMGPLYGVALTLALGCALLRPGLTRRDGLWLVGGHGAVGLLYLPGLLILLDQAPTWVKTTWLDFGVADLAAHLPMLFAAPGWPCLAALALLALAFAALWRRREGRRTIAMLVALAAVPVILSITVSLAIAPVFITRTLAPAAVPALLLYAVGVAAWSDSLFWRVTPKPVRPEPVEGPSCSPVSGKEERCFDKLSTNGFRSARLYSAMGWLAIAAALALGANMLAVEIQTRAIGAMQPWYKPVDLLARRFRSGDQILAYPNEGALPLAYALRDKGLAFPIRAIPGPVPAFDERGGFYVTGSRGVVSLPAWRLREIAHEPATRARPTLWLLRLGVDTYDPEDVALDEFSAGRHLVASYDDGTINLLALRKDGLAWPPADPPLKGEGDRRP